MEYNQKYYVRYNDYWVPGNQTWLAGKSPHFLPEVTGQSISYIWLVVSTPLKNISQLGLLFPIYGKNVPNHQSDIHMSYVESRNTLVDLAELLLCSFLHRFKLFA
jgi:hypothetical protein